MTQRKRVSATLIAAYIALFLLIVAAIVIGINSSNLHAQVQDERNSTPTPLPAYGNAMQVTVDPSLPTPGPLLRTGSTGKSVIDLQNRLKELGYYTGEVDGQFGPATESAVRLFQHQHGLDVDGKVGSQTNAVLYSAQATRLMITPAPAPTATPTLAPTNEPIVLPVQTPPGLPGVQENGMPLLVNREQHLPEGYQTVDLVMMRSYCDSSVVTIKGSEIQGERIAVDALMTMLRAAQAEGLKKWQVNAGYRSVAYQQQLFDDRVYAYRQEGLSGSEARAKVRQTVADPGASEHHTGLAFDVAVTGEPTFATTKQSSWLAQHCWEYGFIIRYPLDKVDITGFSYEPWHIRYVGVEHSMIMYRENLCLEEYLAKYSN